ncbi:unnamed protein product [Closterium sp. NIES-64]|nr:unnamed protein product [Closterium sp. NIES-64]
MGDVAADLKQTSDVAKLHGQEEAPPPPPPRGKENWDAGAGKRNSGAAPKVSAAGKRKSGAAAPKTPAAPAAGAKGVPKKQAGSNPDAASKPSAAPTAGAAAVPKQEAGAKDTSGAAPKAPAAASEPRALLEAADSDAALIDSVDFASVDSVDSEDSRMLLTMGNAGADLKQLSDDASGAVKNALGQAGRKVRNSVGSMMGCPAQEGQEEAPPPPPPRGKETWAGGSWKAQLRRSSQGAPLLVSATRVRQPPRRPFLLLLARRGFPKKQAGGKVNSGAAAKTPVAHHCWHGGRPEGAGAGGKGHLGRSPQAHRCHRSPQAPHCHRCQCCEQCCARHLIGDQPEDVQWRSRGGWQGGRARPEAANGGRMTL